MIKLFQLNFYNTYQLMALF